MMYMLLALVFGGLADQFVSIATLYFAMLSHGMMHHHPHRDQEVSLYMGL